MSNPVLIVIVLFAAVLLTWFIAVFNSFVALALRVRVQNARADIDVQLKRRHDLIPNLVAAVQGYMAHERSTLEAVTEARTKAVASTAGTVADRAQAESALTARSRTCSRSPVTVPVRITTSPTGTCIAEFMRSITILVAGCGRNQVTQFKRGTALRIWLRELAAERPRLGSRRLYIFLRREKAEDGTPQWPVNHKQVYRLYREEGLAMRRKRRKRFRAEARVPLALPTHANEV